jgi:hypothetical protein
MVNAPKKNFLPCPAGRYGKSSELSTQQYHQANDGNSGWKEEIFPVLVALHSLGSKKIIVGKRRRETHFFSSEEKEKWIQHYVERETAGARKQFEDAEVEVQQEQKATKYAVQQHMERFQQKQMKLDELTQLGWEDAAYFTPDREKMYNTSELMVLAGVQTQTDDDTPAPAPTTFGELMACLDIVPRMLPLLQGTSRPEVVILG